MRSVHYGLIALSLCLLVPSLAQAYSGDRVLSAHPNASQTDAYKETTFGADFRQYKIGDKVPDIYLTEPYNIKQWQLRHLPAPKPDSHWTYMGGNYVLVTNTSGKILEAMSGDIFFEH